MLTVKEVRQKHGPKFFPVDIPEWDGEVLVKRLRATDYIAICNLEETGTKQEQEFEVMRLLIKACLVNDDGTPFITDEDDDLLTDNPLLVLRLGRDLMDKFGMNRKVIKKNSETTASSSSPSDSASHSESSTPTDSPSTQGN